MLFEGQEQSLFCASCPKGTPLPGKSAANSEQWHSLTMEAVWAWTLNSHRKCKNYYIWIAYHYPSSRTNSWWARKRHVLGEAGGLKPISKAEEKQRRQDSRVLHDVIQKSNDGWAFWGSVLIYETTGAVFSNDELWERMKESTEDGHPVREAGATRRELLVSHCSIPEWTTILFLRARKVTQRSHLPIEVFEQV